MKHLRNWDPPSSYFFFFLLLILKHTVHRAGQWVIFMASTQPVTETTSLGLHTFLDKLTNTYRGDADITESFEKRGV